jgi:hypothetical protein
MEVVTTGEREGTTRTEDGGDNGRQGQRTTDSRERQTAGNDKQRGTTRARDDEQQRRGTAGNDRDDEERRQRMVGTTNVGDDGRHERRGQHTAGTTASTNSGDGSPPSLQTRDGGAIFCFVFLFVIFFHLLPTPLRAPARGA